jgi:hypothetical protein
MKKTAKKAAEPGREAATVNADLLSAPEVQILNGAEDCSGVVYKDDSSGHYNDLNEPQQPEIDDLIARIKGDEERKVARNMRRLLRYDPVQAINQFYGIHAKGEGGPAMEFTTETEIVVLLHDRRDGWESVTRSLSALSSVCKDFVMVINNAYKDAKLPAHVERLLIRNGRLDRLIREIKEKGGLTQNHQVDQDTTEEIDAEIAKEAVRIVSDPDVEIVKWLCDVVSSMHIGDEKAITALILSLIVASVENSAGIHPSLHGASGKGKSSAAKKVAHIAPLGRVLEMSVSPMSLYYAAAAGLIKPGTIIFSDDTELKDESRETIKRSSTNYQRKTRHMTVHNGEALIKEVPERIGWWLTSVDPDAQDQILNRQFQHDVDEGDDQDEKVYQHQVKRLAIGGSEFPETRDIKVSREVLRLVCDGVHRAAVPYADRIEWNGKENRRNFPLFGDIIACYAVANRFKPDRAPVTVKDIDGSEVQAIPATEKDFEAAKELYSKRAKNKTLNLSNTEIKVYDILASRLRETGRGEVTIEEVMTETGKSETTARYLMLGRDGNGGMCAKVPGLRHERQTISEVLGDWRDGDRKGRPKKVFIYEPGKKANKITQFSAQDFDNMANLRSDDEP